MRTRHGRVVRPPRDHNFNYSFMLPNSLFIHTSSASSTLRTNIPSLFYASASCMSHVVHSGPAISLQKSRIRREQRARATYLGELVQLVTDSGGVERMAFMRMAFMRKTSGMLFSLDVELQDWVCLFDGATLTDLERFADSWPRPAISQPLTDEGVRLPRTLADFHGFELGRHESPAMVTRICGTTSFPSVRSPPVSVAHRRLRQTLLLHRLPQQLRPRPPRLQSPLLLQDQCNQLW